MIYTSHLISANFAINAAEGDPEALARLFIGMTVGSARNVLKLAERGQLRRPAQNQIEIPDSEVAS